MSTRSVLPVGVLFSISISSHVLNRLPHALHCRRRIVSESLRSRVSVTSGFSALQAGHFNLSHPSPVP